MFDSSVLSAGQAELEKLQHAFDEQVVVSVLGAQIHGLAQLVVVGAERKLQDDEDAVDFEPCADCGCGTVRLRPRP